MEDIISSWENKCHDIVNGNKLNTSNIKKKKYKGLNRNILRIILLRNKALKELTKFPPQNQEQYHKSLRKFEDIDKQKLKYKEYENKIWKNIRSSTNFIQNPQILENRIFNGKMEIILITIKCLPNI